MTATRYNEKLFKTYKRYSKDHKKDIMHEDTYYKYLGDASAFINQVITTRVASIKTKKELKNMLEENNHLLVTTMKACAATKTSDSWRKLRRGLIILHKAAGISDLAKNFNVDNPLPVSDRSHNTKKSRRLSKVTDKVYSDIFTDRQDAEDTDSLCLMRLGRNLGTRPSEAPKLEIVEASQGKGITVRVHGSKKTLLGERDKSKSRGLNRILTVPYDTALHSALIHAKGLDDRTIGNAQERIARASKRLFSNSDKHFCLYSLRYTFGSNLKRQLYETEGGRIVAAAVMGHKNTSSISSYGSFQAGDIGAEIPQVDADTIKLVQDDIASKFKKDRGSRFDIGESIRNREYRKDLDNDLDDGLFL